MIIDLIEARINQMIQPKLDEVFGIVVSEVEVAEIPNEMRSGLLETMLEDCMTRFMTKYKDYNEKESIDYLKERMDFMVDAVKLSYKYDGE